MLKLKFIATQGDFIASMLQSSFLCIQKEFNLSLTTIWIDNGIFLLQIALLNLITREINSDRSGPNEVRFIAEGDKIVCQ